MKIWPFMFAASATLDYRFVVRPDFLDAEQDTLFRERLEIEGSDQDVRTITFSDSKNKTIHCWYQASPILVGDEAQTDSVGRKLFCASGIITIEPPSGESLRQLIDRARRVRPLLDRNLVSFLAADRSWKPMIVSASDLGANLPAMPVATPPERKLVAPPAATRPVTDKPALDKSTAILTALMVFSLAFCAMLFAKYQSLEKEMAEIKSKLPSPRPADAPSTSPAHRDAEPQGRKDPEAQIHKELDVQPRKDAEPPLRKDAEPQLRKEQPKNIE